MFSESIAHLVQKITAAVTPWFVFGTVVFAVLWFLSLRFWKRLFVKPIAQCREMFGGALTVRTSGTCPSGAAVPIPDDAAMVDLEGRSEIRISMTRQQLKTLGLLPQNDEDGVNEMAWLDMA